MARARSRYGSGPSPVRLTPTALSAKAETTEDGEEDQGSDGQDEMMAERGLAGYSQAAEEKGVPEWVPDWVGYSFLYGLSGIPVLIVVTVVIVLFVNSLR